MLYQSPAISLMSDIDPGKRCFVDAWTKCLCHIRMVNATGSTSQFVHPTLDIFGSKLKNTAGPEFNLFYPNCTLQMLHASCKTGCFQFIIECCCFRMKCCWTKTDAIGPIGPYKTEECGLVRDCWKAVDDGGGGGRTHCQNLIDRDCEQPIGGRKEKGGA